MLDRKISILIPDGESPVLMIVLNCLSETKGIKIHVMSNIEDIPMKYSKNIYKFSYYPKTDSETDLIDNINKEVEEQNIDLILPIFEDSVRIILKHKDLITSTGKLALLPSYTNFNKAINKGELTKHLKESSIPFPKSKILEQKKTFNIDEIDYPVLVKPVEGIGGGSGIYVLKEKSAFKEFLNSDKFNCTYLAQDYIEGYDIDCSVLCKDGKIQAYTIQKANMHGYSKFEPQYAVEFLQEDMLYAVVKKLMKSLNWSGVAHVDMRYDEQTNDFKVIEVNPRYWGSVEASLLAGVNFPYLHCVSSLNYNFDIPKYKSTIFMNMKGVVKSIKENKSFLLKLNFLFKNTPLKYYIKDPKSTLYRFSRFFLRKIKS